MLAPLVLAVASNGSENGSVQGVHDTSLAVVESSGYGKLAGEKAEPPPVPLEASTAIEPTLPADASQLLQHPALPSVSEPGSDTAASTAGQEPDASKTTKADAQPANVPSRSFTSAVVKALPVPPSADGSSTSNTSSAAATFSAPAPVSAHAPVLGNSGVQHRAEVAIPEAGEELHESAPVSASSGGQLTAAATPKEAVAAPEQPVSLSTPAPVPGNTGAKRAEADAPHAAVDTQEQSVAPASRAPVTASRGVQRGAAAAANGAVKAPEQSAPVHVHFQESANSDAHRDSAASKKGGATNGGLKDTNGGVTNGILKETNGKVKELEQPSAVPARAPASARGGAQRASSVATSAGVKALRHSARSGAQRASRASGGVAVLPESAQEALPSGGEDTLAATPGSALSATRGGAGSPPVASGAVQAKHGGAAVEALTLPSDGEHTLSTQQEEHDTAPTSTPPTAAEADFEIANTSLPVADEAASATRSASGGAALQQQDGTTFRACASVPISQGAHPRPSPRSVSQGWFPGCVDCGLGDGNEG